MAATLKGQHKEPVPKWTTREQLILASSVQRSGNQNWISVSRAIRPLVEETRPPDYFSQKNCALQYAAMLDKVSTPKRKRKEDSASDVVETVEEQIVRHFTSKRIKELDRELNNSREEYMILKKEIEQLERGELDDQLETLWEQAQQEASEGKLLKSSPVKKPLPITVGENEPTNNTNKESRSEITSEEKGEKGKEEETPLIRANKPLQLMLKKEPFPLLKSPLVTSSHALSHSTTISSNNESTTVQHTNSTPLNNKDVDSSSKNEVVQQPITTHEEVLPTVISESNEDKSERNKEVSFPGAVGNEGREEEMEQESVVVKEKENKETVTTKEEVVMKQEVVIKQEVIQEEEEDVIVDVVKTSGDEDIKKELEATPPDTPLNHKKRKQDSPEQIETPPLKEPNKSVVVEEETIRVRRGRPPGKRGRKGHGRLPKIEHRDTPPGEEESEEENLSAFSSAVSSPCPSHSELDPESHSSYRNWKKTIMLVWRHAAQHKYANLFLHPVREEDAPGYYDVILRPMDLTTIKKNIESGVIRKDVEFQRDMMLIFQNAFMYNSSDHDVYKMAEEMRTDVIENIQEYLLTQMMVQSSSSKALRSRESKGSVEETKLKKSDDPSPARKRRLRLDD